MLADCEYSFTTDTVKDLRAFVPEHQVEIRGIKIMSVMLFRRNVIGLTD